MRKEIVVPVVALAVLVGGGAALASHVMTVPPSQVPVGMLAAHNAVEDVPVSALVRAVTPRGTDLSVQHVRLAPDAPVPWHTHPGPAFVGVVGGSLTYEGALANRCRRIVYSIGEGFVDRGFGHVHRVVAGPEGADFYVAYLLPRGSETHVLSASAPAECVS